MEPFERDSRIRTSVEINHVARATGMMDDVRIIELTHGPNPWSRGKSTSFLKLGRTRQMKYTEFEGKDTCRITLRFKIALSGVCFRHIKPHGNDRIRSVT
ncbi:hypothetical protein TNIN_173611 [Trichonephila inaurata madagascariensis]|uniref:Uncharacterized protein n=1 Tax=Trichonephila inaurata madagascariensis TaxID=2747483 RepID=A0A8X6M8R1_9ARAC|nr:hypothetical protein TNIN_173611 [Trichonephila inaurata madagascariensis]